MSRKLAREHGGRVAERNVADSGYVWVDVARQCRAGRFQQVKDDGREKGDEELRQNDEDVVDTLQRS